MQELGSTWEWLENGNLRTVTSVVPGTVYFTVHKLFYHNCASMLFTYFISILLYIVAIRVDEGANRTNKKTFFNSMVAAYTGWNDSRNKGEECVISGDTNSTLDPVFMQDAVDIMNEIRVCSQWQEGDVYLLDNRTVMHSRCPYEGKRRVLASLVRDGDR